MDTLTRDRMVRTVDLQVRKPDPERILWFFLRNHHLMNMKFRRSARVGEFMAEFLCDEKKLVVELEQSRSGRVRDRERGKDSWMESQGFKILRFWDNEVLENMEGVIYAILECGGEL